MSDPSSSWQKPLPPLPPGQGGSDGAADSEDERDDLAQGNRLDEHIKSVRKYKRDSRCRALLIGKAPIAWLHLVQEWTPAPSWMRVDGSTYGWT